MAVPADEELQELLDEFVCVRIVQMWAVDLHKFEFDGSLTWAIFFMNADGSIYGRSGSRSGLQKQSAREISLAGFKKSLRGALALHASYAEDQDGVRAGLAGKIATEKPPWPTPEVIPAMKATARFENRFLGEPKPGHHGGCIHCHMIPTNELKSLRRAEKPIPDRKFYPYPMPDQLGFRMDPKEMATVERVDADSIAAAGGLRQGDVFLRLEGQPILSTADIQWVLHNAADRDTLQGEVARGDRVETVGLELPDGWRTRLADWRFINKGLLRQMLGFNVTSLPKTRARRLGLTGKLGLEVDRTTPEIRRQTGLGHRDLIVALDDDRAPKSVGAFTAYVFREKPAGSTLKITILRISDRPGNHESDIEVTVEKPK